MGLFSSKFAILESYVDKKATERNAEDLTNAQVEMDRANAGLLLVPKTDTIKTGKDLDNHINGLTTRAEKAENDLAEANKTIAKLKGTTPETGNPEEPVVENSPAPGTELSASASRSTRPRSTPPWPHKRTTRPPTASTTRYNPRNPTRWT